MADAFAKHFRVKELAALWGFSANTVIALFADEPDVLRLERSTGKRKYVTLSIPESAALRVHERLADKPLKTQLPRRNPRSVVFLRDRNRRVA